MVVEFAATSISTHSTKNIKQLTEQIDKTSLSKLTTELKTIIEQIWIAFSNRILEKLLTQNSGACNQDLNSSKPQERKFLLTVPYSGKRQPLFSKIYGF